MLNYCLLLDSRLVKECPRCGEDVMKEPIEKNSITNEDKKTFICFNCGLTENRIIFFKAKNRKNMIPKIQVELSKKFREKLGID